MPKRRAERDGADPTGGADFVEALVADLRAVEPAAPLPRALFGWMGAAWLIAGLLLAVLGPARGGVIDDLETPRLALELALGLATGLAFTIAALEVGVPGRPALTRLIAPAVLLGSVWFWIAMGGLSIEGPAPSMVGKREHCFLEGLAIGALPVLLGLRAVGQRAVGSGPIAGAFLGLAAGAIPALAMQIACMYEPGHALRFHFTPMLVLAAAGAVLGALVLTRD